MEVIPTILTDRLILLIAGLLLSVMLFGPLKLYQALGLDVPARIMRRTVKTVIRKLNRERRSAGTRVYRGIILLLFFTVFAALAGYVIQRAILSNAWFQLLEMLVIAYLIPLRHVRDEAAEVARAIKRKDPDRAAKILVKLARRQPQHMDEHAMYRVAMEYLAENWCDQIVSPILWYLLFGLPGLCVVRMINLLDGMVGYRSKEFIAFGWAAAKMDDIIQLIPARIAGILFCLAAIFIPKARPLAAANTIIRQSGDTASPNSGWPIAAMAGALNISLCGPRRLADTIIDDAWIGSGTARVTRIDMRRALALYAVAVILLLLFCLLGLAFLSQINLFSIEAFAHSA